MENLNISDGQTNCPKVVSYNEDKIALQVYFNAPLVLVEYHYFRIEISPLLKHKFARRKYAKYKKYLSVQGKCYSFKYILR